MFCAIVFPKISCLYLSKFTLARSMYSLGSSDIFLNILRLLMSVCFLCVNAHFSSLSYLEASLVLHQYWQPKMLCLPVQTLITTSHHHNFINTFCA